jgi:hypothetical protein
MTLPREQWEFRDPSGAGICPICRFPIEVHPLDAYGVDIARCPDRYNGCDCVPDHSGDAQRLFDSTVLDPGP